MDSFDFKQKFYYMNSGNSSGPTALNAFDRALLSAGCGNYNLLKVSSILPLSSERANKVELQEGSLLPIAYAKLIAGPDEFLGCEISAAVAIGIPTDLTKCGVIMEFSDVCQEKIALDEAISMVKTAMEDRQITDYSIESCSTSCVSTRSNYNCVFACVALFDKHLI